MKMRRLGLAVAALLVAMPVFAGAAEAPSYTVTLLYGPPDNPAVQATGINNNGDIVGVCSSGGINAARYMFLYSGGSYYTLPNAPNAAWNSTNPLGINDFGFIVGNYVSGAGSLAGNEHGFLYEKNIFYITIDDPYALPDSNRGAWTEAHGINDHGDIVGVYRDSNDIFHAYLFSLGAFTAFSDDPVGIAGTTTPYGIDDNGDIVGSYKDNIGLHGFLYSGGSFITLDDPNGMGSTVATGVNDYGEVVGWCVNSSGRHEGFLYNGGAFTTIDATNGAGGDTWALGINDSGKIVGKMSSADGSLQAGYVAAPNLLWRGAVELDGGWEWLSWFGYFNTTYAPWIWHQTLGWLYPYGNSTDSVWFWDQAMNGFWWTNRAIYPYLYRAGDGAWLFYVEGSSNPQWFFNFQTSKWESY